MSKPRRSNVKNASLKKNYNSKIRQEYLDQDYLADLDDTKKVHMLPNGKMVTELEWLAIFMKEYNSGGVGSQKNAKKNVFHRTPEEVKSCTDRTNARNRDQYGIAKATKMTTSTFGPSLTDYVENQEAIDTNYVEDAMIDYLDHVKESEDSADDTDY